ncbi:MAG: hypothetical protein WC554_13280, partial [Clostridia bacterium]
MTGGHLSLISRYIQDPSVNEIQVLVGSSTRGDIDQAMAVCIAKSLILNDKIKIKAVDDVSPMTTAYNFIKTADPGTYCLAASSKEEENVNRIKRFVFGHNSGKYPLPSNVKVIEMSVNIEPLLYSKRNDEYNGKPISGTILRQDISTNNFENFKTNYPECSIET